MSALPACRLHVAPRESGAGCSTCVSGELVGDPAAAGFVLPFCASQKELRKARS